MNKSQQHEQMQHMFSPKANISRRKQPSFPESLCASLVHSIKHYDTIENDNTLSLPIVLIIFPFPYIDPSHLNCALPAMEE